MPVDRIFSSGDKVWGLWNITESEALLQSEIPLDTIPSAITNPAKRLEFLAGRALLKALLKRWDLPYSGLVKDAFGKPYLAGSELHVSISHSYPFVAAVLHRSRRAGIDLEQPKEKLLRIASRIMEPRELADAGTDVIKHCIYWCAKETLVKIYGKKDLIFSRDLLISPFSLEKSGLLVGRILANNTETTIPLAYLVADSFVVVVSE